jgi:hypothetical protein
MEFRIAQLSQQGDARGIRELLQTRGIEIPEDLNEQQLVRLAPSLLAQAQGSGRGPYQRAGISEQGTLLRFNRQTGEFEDTGVKAGEKLKQYRDPKTGEIKFYQERSGFAKGQEPKEESKEEQTFFETLTPVQRKDLKEVRSSFEKETKDSRASLDKLKGLSEKQIQDAIDNPISASQLGAQVATIFENGRLTDEDVLRYTRRQGIPDRVADSLVKLRAGTISDEKAADIKQSLDVFRAVLQEQITTRAMEKARILENAYGVPSSDVVPLIYPRYDEIQQKAVDNVKIKVKLPDGRMGSVPRKNLDRAIQMGAEVIE